MAIKDQPLCTAIGAITATPRYAWAPCSSSSPYAKYPTWTGADCPECGRFTRIDPQTGAVQSPHARLHCAPAAGLPPAGARLRAV